MSERHVTMIPVPEKIGAWQGASSADRRRLARLQIPRTGDIRDPARRWSVAHLVALCAARGISITFEPAAGPSPAPGKAGFPRPNGRSG